MYQQNAINNSIGTGTPTINKLLLLLLSTYNFFAITVILLPLRFLISYTSLRWSQLEDLQPEGKIINSIR